MVREGQNIELHRDSRTTSANLSDHRWSAEQTLGITALRSRFTDYLLHPVTVYRQGEGSRYTDKTVDLLYRQKGKMSICRGITVSLGILKTKLKTFLHYFQRHLVVYLFDFRYLRNPKSMPQTLIKVHF